MILFIFAIFTIVFGLFIWVVEPIPNLTFYASNYCEKSEKFFRKREQNAYKLAKKDIKLVKEMVWATAITGERSVSVYVKQSNCEAVKKFLHSRDFSVTHTREKASSVFASQREIKLEVQW